jgi:hypothetical protein
MFKRFGAYFLAALLGTLCLGLSDRLSGLRDIGYVSTAQAIVGRPLTPVSVAGVARRTARRCAVGVYSC